MKRTMIACAVIAAAMAYAWAQDKEVAVDQNKEVTVEQTKTPGVAEVSGPLGAKTNPVRCNMPAVERAYLARLRGPDGKPPSFHRVGSFAPGPYGNLLDGYEVTSGANTVMVFMDMYHPGVAETNAVPGFTIVNK